MNFSYGEVWNDTVAALKANASLLVAIAGAFLFLPALLTAYLIPPPEAATTIPEMVARMSEYIRTNWHWSFLANIVNMVGTLAIYQLLLAPDGRTVGGTIVDAVRYVPSYFILWILIMVPITVGFFLLIVPGIYLMGRLAISGAVLVGERQLNPIAAVGAAFARTRGKGWTVAGLILLVAVSGMILMIAVEAVLGSAFLLVGGGRDGVGGLLVAVLNAALGAAFSTVMIVLLAAIYRALGPATSGT